jgi:hypothetical protein
MEPDAQLARHVFPGEEAMSRKRESRRSEDIMAHQSASAAKA